MTFKPTWENRRWS